MKRDWYSRRFRPAAAAVLAGLFGAGIAMAEVGQSSPSAAPATNAVASRGSITQYGITWTFEQPAKVGRFVNGDFYVIGPVTITGIDPRPLVGKEVPEKEVVEAERKRIKDGKYIRNGSMLNPPARDQVAYDTGIMNYSRPDLVAVPPIHLKPGDCLVSCISLKPGEKSQFPYHSEGSREKDDDSPIKTAAVLTCMATELPADAFRPSYGDRQQKIYLARYLKKELLKRLPPPAETPNLLAWIRVFERPWLNTCFFGFEQPMENMPHYGQWVGQAQSMGGLLLMLDLDSKNKERLMINMVQVGIDYWGLVRNGHPGWQGWGGHGSGRKFPIVLAGVLLGDEDMASPTRSFPKVEFGEDNQTMAGQAWTGGKGLFAGHSGIQSATGKPERPEWGPYEHLPPSKWNKGNFTSECYRRANTSSSWVGQALVLRMLHAERAWNHNAFFEYVDRWMSEDDREPGRIVMQSWPELGLNDHDQWNRPGFAWEPFVQVMWAQYHGQVMGESGR